jgi:hypothetical protein
MCVNSLNNRADVEDDRSEDKGPSSAIFGGERPNKETGEESCIGGRKLVLCEMDDRF